MFLHLGGDKIVPKKDIIAILDCKKGTSSITREFIQVATDEGFVENISDQDKEKSFVITTEKIFVSPISCNTLKKRSLISIGAEEKEVIGD
ncbi:MAG: extracellular matrix regulator RemB [Desulfocucumaceae bacterium]